MPPRRLVLALADATAGHTVGLAHYLHSPALSRGVKHNQHSQHNPIHPPDHGHGAAGADATQAYILQRATGHTAFLPHLLVTVASAATLGLA